MSFKQYMGTEQACRSDETYRAEEWAGAHPGRAYYDVHLAAIEGFEMNTPVFREFLGRGGMRVLESGCGTGRWMAFFEKLGNRTVGLDDSAGPLRVAREHDPAMTLVRASALLSPFKDNSFDAVFSSYVAEHFEEGPEALFREIHRVVKPGGLFFVVVPFNNAFRRVLVNPILRLRYLVWRLRRRPVAFTEFRYTKSDMDGFLARSRFEVLRVLPDDFILPWSKGLYLDLCDVGVFIRPAPRLFQLGRFETRVARLIQSFGIWHCCGGIFYVARAEK
jgi:SAM-dependent methyltransferase